MVLIHDPTLTELMEGLGKELNYQRGSGHRRTEGGGATAPQPPPLGHFLLI